ncbi:MAG: type II toxin-antitoxin system VapC family toxin [Planctomycetaceae bacterium]
MAAIQFVRGQVLPPSIYVDANVASAFLYRSHIHYNAAATFFMEASAQTRKLFVSPLTMDEIWHTLMKTSHLITQGPVLKPTAFKSSKPNHVGPQVSSVDLATRALLGLSSVTFCDAQPGAALTNEATRVLKTHHLGPRDCFHYAVASLAGVAAFATIDSDFDALAATAPRLTILKV